MERASGLGFRLFFSFLPKQPSCVFWRPVNHSSSSGKRGEEYMIQPSKNAGRLGARVEEARNQPRAGSSSRPSCRARPSVPGQQLAPQPRVVRPGRAGHAAARWEPSREGSPGSQPPPLHCAFPAGQVASKISKLSTFAQLKEKKNTEDREERSECFGKAALGWQAGSLTLGSPIFLIYQRASGGCAGQIPPTQLLVCL